MVQNIVDSYGWDDPQETLAASYITSVVLRQLNSLNVRRVLDLGSGNGALCARLKASGLDVVGVEYDQGGVDIARHAHPDINFHRFGIHDDPSLLLGLETNFDAVVSTEVVEHLFSPHLLPVYARAVLRTGGYLIISTPYHGYLKNLMLSVFDRWDTHHTPLWHGGHIKFWSRRTLTRLINDNGFNVTDFSGAGRMPYLWKSMVITAVKTP